MSNQFVLVGVPLIFILMLITIFINQNALRAIITGVGIAFLVASLLLNKVGFTTFSRVGLSFLMPLVILAITIFPKLRNSGIIPVVEYFQHRFLFLASTCLPILLIHHREEKVFFWPAVLVNFVLLLTLDPIYNYLSIGPLQKYSNDPILQDYYLINVYDEVVWGVISFSFFFLKEINYRFENVMKISNQNLSKVHQEVLTQNEELKQSQEEITSQRDHIERKNSELNLMNQKLKSGESVLKKSFEKLKENEMTIQQKNKSLEDRNHQISHSLNAAKIIQEAINPDDDYFQTFFDSYFVLYKPKDTVSGDFYWIRTIQDYHILVVADCTGHGVAGAFMTLIGNSLLDKLTPNINPENPAELLNNLHQEVWQMLKQGKTNNNSGMDVAIISWKAQNGGYQVNFAGAKSNLLYHLPTGEALEEVKASRKSIGGFQNEEIKFENHQFYLPIGTSLYLGSDGLEDQNNQKRKKFGRKRLKSLLLELSELSMIERGEKLSTALENHMKETEQRDDILFIGLKI